MGEGSIGGNTAHLWISLANLSISWLVLQVGFILEATQLHGLVYRTIEEFGRNAE
jgi:hypothetical protein